MKLFAKFAAFGAAALLSTSVFAHPIAAVGTEGLAVVASGGDVVATYQGTTASYSDDLLYLSGFIFNNHTTPVGTTFNLGSFAAGTELIFQLQVNNTGNNWYTGLASRNSDGKFHARVQANWQPNTTLVSFEDLAGDPEGANGFNDLSFSFTNTKSSSVPESSSLMLLLAGLGLIGFARRKKA